MLQDTSTKYIFIVGVSRSGTTLMRRVLNRSDQVGISNENHFLGHLIPFAGARHKFRKFGDLSEDDNVRRVVDFIYSGEFEKSTWYRGTSFHWEWIVRWIDKDLFLQRVLDSDRSERALFVTMMRVFADHWDKPIMGEKTPAHLRYVKTLMTWFPDAKVIHMLRDPRGNFVSELRRRSQLPVTPPYKQLKRFGFLLKLYIMLQTTVVWYDSVRRYTRYKERYPNNYRLLKFEDLVREPEKQLGELCEFLGIEFQDRMLEQTVVSRGFQLGKTGFDAAAATRWQEHIDPWIDRWFRFWLGKPMRRFGYLDVSSKSASRTDHPLTNRDEVTSDV